MYLVPNEEFERLKTILDPIDLSDILIECIKIGDNDQYSIMDAIKVKVPEIEEFYSDDILIYLVQHYTIEARPVNYHRIYEVDHKIEKIN